jgi:hypothetical protein
MFDAYVEDSTQTLLSVHLVLLGDDVVTSHARVNR